MNIKEFKEIIRSNDLNSLQLYIIRNNINLNEYGYDCIEETKQQIIKRRNYKNQYNSFIYLKNVVFDPLIYSIENECSNIVIKFIATKYYNLDYDIQEGKNPLFIALQHKYFTIVDLLLHNNADLYYINSKGQNVIQYILDNDDYLTKNQLNFLIKKNFNINCKIYTISPINKIMKVQSCLEFLLKNSSKDNVIENINLIIKQLLYNNDFIIKLITIVKNQKCISQEILNKLIYNEKKKIMITKKIYEVIITLNDPMLLNSIFFYDVNFENELNKKVIIDENKGYKLLSNSISKSNLEVLKLLNKKGFSVNEFNDNGVTPLIQAIYFNKTNYVYYLVSHGADVNKKSKKDEFPILCAVKKYNIEILKYLLKNNANPNQQDNKGNTTLMYASQFGNIQAIKCLLDNNADINMQNKEGLTALMIALTSNRAEAIDLLLDYSQININLKSNKGLNAIMFAAKNSKFDIFTLLMNKIEKTNININETDNEGFNALMYACMCSGGQLYVYHSFAYLCKSILSYSYIIKDILNRNINFKQKSKNGKNALMIAASHGSLNMVKTLINFGMNIHEVDNDNCTILMYACKNHILTLYKRLEREIQDINVNTIMDFAKNMYDEQTDIYDNNYNHNVNKYGYIHLVRYLVEQGVNINAKDSKGNNALIIASTNGFLNLVEYLLINKIHINEKNNQGYTALMCAAMYGHLNTVKCLINHGADTKILDNNGNNVLLLAVREGQLEVVRYLIELGLNVHEKNLDEKNALLIAIEYDHQNLVQYLHQQGINPNEKNNKGWNALITAAHYSRPNMVRYFNEAGVDINMVDNIGRSALMHCLYMYGDQKYPFISNNVNNISRLMNNSFTTIKYLIEQGAKVNIQDSSGLSPLAVAACNGPLQNVKYLIDMGANINLLDNEGNDILFWARKSKFFENYINIISNKNDKILFNSLYTPIIEATCLSKTPENFNTCHNVKKYKTSNYQILIDYLLQIKKSYLQSKESKSNVLFLREE